LERGIILSIAIFLLGLIGSILITLGIPPWFGVYAVNVTLVVFGFIFIIAAIVLFLAVAFWEII
jgi:hypothetical protein